MSNTIDTTEVMVTQPKVGSRLDGVLAVLEIEPISADKVALHKHTMFDKTFAALRPPNARVIHQREFGDWENDITFNYAHRWKNDWHRLEFWRTNVGSRELLLANAPDLPCSHPRSSYEVMAADSQPPSVADPAGIFRPLVVFCRECNICQRLPLQYSPLPVYVALRWHMKAYEEVEKSVPDFVRRKAEQIKVVAPDAVLKVDGLESETRNYDPFLVVELEGQVAYVEVWGEDDKELNRS